VAHISQFGLIFPQSLPVSHPPPLAVETTLTTELSLSAVWEISGIIFLIHEKEHE